MTDLDAAAFVGSKIRLLPGSSCQRPSLSTVRSSGPISNFKSLPSGSCSRNAVSRIAARIPLRQSNRLVAPLDGLSPSRQMKTSRRWFAIKCFRRDRLLLLKTDREQTSVQPRH